MNGLERYESFLAKDHQFTANNEQTRKSSLTISLRIKICYIVQKPKQQK